MANKNKANALVSNLGIGKSSSTKQETKEVAEPRPSVEAGVRKAMHVQRLYSTKI